MDRVEERLARYYALVFEEERGPYDLGERFMHLSRPTGFPVKRS